MAILVLCQSTSLAAEIEVIVYADDGYAPYSYEESGEAKGTYAVILRAAFARMEGYRVAIRPVPWKRGLRLLEQGKGFALYPPYRHVESRPYIRPYSTPILDEEVVVLCREDILIEPRPEWPRDFYGLTIGVNAGYLVGGDEFWRAVKEKKIRVEECRGNSEGLMQLAKGRLDGYINDRMAILWELKRLRESGKYREDGAHAKLLVGATISVEQGHLGYTDRDEGRFAYKADFVKQFNAIIKEMKKSGDIQRIVDEFLK
jgi:polar amino acid transport system substrate-binding protein